MSQSLVHLLLMHLSFGAQSLTLLHCMGSTVLPVPIKFTIEIAVMFSLGLGSMVDMVGAVDSS